MPLDPGYSSDYEEIRRNPPGEAPIPELQNLQQSLAGIMRPAAQISPEVKVETERALGNLRTWQAQRKVQSQMSEGVFPPQSLKVNTMDGTVDISKLPIATYEAIMRDRQELNQIRGGFAQEAERLKNQEQQVRSQPWMQLATALSANLAQAKDMPGWVQAAGRTSAQLNPTADELRNQKLAVLQQQAQAVEKGGALNIAAARTLEERQTMALNVEKQRLAQIEKVSDDLAQAIGKGVGAMDAKGAAALLTQAGATPKELEAHMGRLEMTAKNVGQAFSLTRDDKAKAEARAQENALSIEKLRTMQTQAITQKLGEKSEADKAMDVAAQGIAAGDLTTIRAISSMRGDQRLRLYARVKEIDPKFNTAEMDRKINMEQSFTSGKDGQSIQSFDTFLQHAGEAVDTIKGIEMTDSKLLNKSLNWWRRNMKGTPELAKLEVALEPVGKEFESFLLNQRALYVDDRKQIEKLLNADQPIGVKLAALQQMGKTAQDRYGAMNQRYKRVMKQDIQYPFSEEAVSAATKIGISLPTEATISTPPLGARDAGGPRQKVTKYPWE